MSIMHFATGNMTGKPVELATTSVSALAFSPATATAALQLSALGEVQQSLNGGSYTTLYDWLIAGAASGYECRMTMTGGTTFTGTLGSWLSLGSNRIWSLARSGIGDVTGTALLEIRGGGGVVLASCTVTLNAGVEP